MPPVISKVCPGCQRKHRGGRLCKLCGHLFQVEPTTPPAQVEGAVKTYPASLDSDPSPLTPWLFLGAGALTAPLFLTHGFLGFISWFLSSLTHEMGHAATGWLFGMPSVPAIRLDGHAAAFHGEQMMFLVGIFAIAFSGYAWSLGEGRRRNVFAGSTAAVYLLLALTPIREALFLVSGHLGECLFACVCLWRTMTGGFTSSQVERLLYGTVGCFLVGSNVFLTAGLTFSEKARDAYATSGSFGLTNDYIRLARDTGLPLPLIGAMATLATLALAGFVLLMVYVKQRRASA